MNDMWLTVGVPAVAGVGTAVYTIGGRAALTRRAIKEELEMAGKLPLGEGRSGLERMAEERAVLYAARWIGPGHLSLRQHIFMLGWLATAACLGWTANWVIGQTDNTWVTSLALLVFISSIGAVAIGFVVWVSSIWMADNAKTRVELIDIRRERVRRHLTHPTAATGTASSAVPPAGPTTAHSASSANPTT